LLKFKESRFTLNHLFNVLKSIKLVCATRTLVTSANNTSNDSSLTIFGKSFMHMRKSKGPKTEPRGTPSNTLVQHETLLHASLSLYSAVDIYFPDMI
jgi:hypothetical protein